MRIDFLINLKKFVTLHSIVLALHHVPHSQEYLEVAQDDPLYIYDLNLVELLHPQWLDFLVIADHACKLR